MWPEFSFVSSVNLAEKIYYNLRDIEFSSGITFYWRALWASLECFSLLHGYE